MPFFSPKPLIGPAPLAALLAMAIVALAPAKPAAAESPEWVHCRDDSGSSQAQAIDACTSLLQASANASSRSFVLALRGRHYYLAKMYEQAIADFDTAIGLDPDLPQPVHYRGLSYAAKGDLDRAITDFSRVIALDPGFAPAYFRRGLAYYGKNDFDHAIADFDQSIARDSADGMSYHYRGLSHSRRASRCWRSPTTTKSSSATQRMCVRSTIVAMPMRPRMMRHTRWPTTIRQLHLIRATRVSLQRAVSSDAAGAILTAR
jgi:tetratricopeptide (TPR) repeat protein